MEGNKVREGGEGGEGKGGGREGEKKDKLFLFYESPKIKSL